MNKILLHPVFADKPLLL